MSVDLGFSAQCPQGLWRRGISQEELGTWVIASFSPWLLSALAVAARSSTLRPCQHPKEKVSTTSTAPSTREGGMLNRLPKSFPFMCNLVTSQRLSHVGSHLRFQARLGRRETTAGVSISHLVRWRPSGPRSRSDLGSQVFLLLLQHSSFSPHGGLS